MLDVKGLEQRIRQALPGAEVAIRDTTGTGDHFEALVISPSFEGKSTVQQHQLVYAPLSELLKSGALHAFALKTFTPEQWKKKAGDGMRPELKSRLDEETRKHKIVLYMKGTGLFPRCGFSAAAYQMLSNHGEVHTVDVLVDPELREGIKEYSNWPTIPQIFINGQFVGGSDIIREMDESGELEKLIHG